MMLASSRVQQHSWRGASLRIMAFASYGARWLFRAAARNALARAARGGGVAHQRMARWRRRSRVKIGNGNNSVAAA